MGDNGIAVNSYKIGRSSEGALEITTECGTVKFGILKVDQHSQIWSLLFCLSGRKKRFLSSY